MNPHVEVQTRQLTAFLCRDENGEPPQKVATLAYVASQIGGCRFEELKNARAYCNVCGEPDDFITRCYSLNVCQSCTHKAYAIKRRAANGDSR